MVLDVGVYECVAKPFVVVFDRFSGLWDFHLGFLFFVVEGVFRFCVFERVVRPLCLGCIRDVCGFACAS